MDSWDEIRTALHVARLGTVSGAAEALGVHHATVIRHVDALEERLGAKLFQRHARGYTATEAGNDLLNVAQATDDQFTQLAGRIRGRGEAVVGDLIVTTINALAPLVVPALVKFQDLHPGVVVRLLTDERVFRLEYGEAHVAVRAGAKPEEPDNVVQYFMPQRGTMYASPSYLEAHGRPKGIDDLVNHRFVVHDSDSARSPFDRWIREQIPVENLAFRATEQSILQRAVCSGAGIGYFAHWDAARYPELVPVVEGIDEWAAPIWLVTHVDLHRTMKVQALTKFLKEEAETWEL